MTKLPVSWEEGHITILSSICTFIISSQCFHHFTFPTHSQHRLVSTFETSLFPFSIHLGKARAPWLPCFIILIIPICPVTHTCTFLFFLSCLLLFLIQATLSVQPALSVASQTCSSILAAAEQLLCRALVAHPLTRAVTWPPSVPPSFSLLCSKCSR